MLAFSFGLRLPLSFSFSPTAKKNKCFVLGKVQALVVNAKNPKTGKENARSTKSANEWRAKKKNVRQSILSFRYIFTLLSFAIRKTFVYFFHSRHVMAGPTLSSFLCLFHPFWPIAKSNGTPRTKTSEQTAQKRRRMQIKFIYYAFLFIWCILFVTLSLLRLECCHCGSVARCTVPS